MTEVWKPVVGFGYYSVSNFGRVMSEKRMVKHRGGMIARGGRVLKPGKHTCGYRTVGLYTNGRSVITRYIHRLVLDAFIGAQPEMDVNHKNGIKEDNRLENLEWVTRKENIRHSIKMGLTKPQKSGLESVHAKLCTDGVRVMSYSEGAKAANYCISYFCGMLNGVYKNKTAFKKAG
jgi:hypothetical protein